MINDNDIKIIKAIQKGIPLTASPFADMAMSVGLSEDDFIDGIKKLKEEKILRRIGFVLHHRRAGFRANALCVWRVPDERVDEVGERVKKEDAVSHCYVRKTKKEWPYNFYAMIHATSHDECEAIAERISKENDIFERRTFYSVREWKKESMKYFMEDSD